MSNRPDIVKEFYRAFSKIDRNDFVENVLSPDFTFSAPPDPLLDRNKFFEKCWPLGRNLRDIKYIRIFEHCDEVIITHEYVKPDGVRSCNTDIITFNQDKIIRLEVYFGWDMIN